MAEATCPLGEQHSYPAPSPKKRCLLGEMGCNGLELRLLDDDQVSVGRPRSFHSRQPYAPPSKPLNTLMVFAERKDTHIGQSFLFLADLDSDMRAKTASPKPQSSNQQVKVDTAVA